MGLAICGLSSIEVEADLFRWSSKFLDSLRISFRFSFSENPRRIFLQGCCTMSRLLRGCRGAFGLLKLAKGRDSGEVISSSQNLVISGELLTVFNCKFFVSTMEKHRRKGVGLWLFKLGETSKSMLSKSNFLRSCLTWNIEDDFTSKWTFFIFFKKSRMTVLTIVCWENNGEAPLSSFSTTSVMSLLFNKLET